MSFLPGMHPGLIGGGDAEYSTLIGAISGLDLSSNLQLCLDAGDANSYASGQSWLDTSGNGFDFFRGTTSGSEAGDPTFNGSSGSRDAYWGFDGGDSFRYDSSNETWMHNLHKNNAQWSAFWWMYVGSSVLQAPFGTSRGVSNRTGVAINTVASAIMEVRVLRSTGGSTALEYDTNFTIPNSEWIACFVSIDEAVGAGGGFVGKNSTVETFNSTYSSPSSGNASDTMEIAAAGSTVRRLSSGSRMGSMAMWEGVALSQANMDALFESTRGWYGVG